MLTIWSGRASASVGVRGGGGDGRGGKTTSDGGALRHRGTHVGTHGGDEDDGASALGDHVARRLARGEECAVDVDVIQTLYPIEGVAGGKMTARQTSPRGETMGRKRHALKGGVVLDDAWRVKDVQ